MPTRKHVRKSVRSRLPAIGTSSFALLLVGLTVISGLTGASTWTSVPSGSHVGTPGGCHCNRDAVVKVPPGTARFPTKYYNASVPNYSDIIKIRIGLHNGTFNFTATMDAAVPAVPNPTFAHPFNHMGPGVLVLTNFSSATYFHPAHHTTFVGLNRTLYGNFLVGVLYSNGSDGLGLGAGWQGYIAYANGPHHDCCQPTTFAGIRSSVYGANISWLVNASSFGTPAAFQFVALNECDPTPLPAERFWDTFATELVPANSDAVWPG